MRDFEIVEKSFEDAIAHRYQRDYHEAPLMQWHDDDFASFVAEQCGSGDRLLDLGCGPASLWPALWRNLPAGCSLVGVDVSEGMLAEARRAEPTGDFRLGSMFSIPCDSGSVDVVVVSSAFHHIPDHALPDALKEINRVLEEHGKLIGREPLMRGRLGDRGGWFSGAIMHFRHLAYRLTRAREYPEPDPGPAHHAYDPAEFLSLLRTQFSPAGIRFRHPFSPYVARTQSSFVAKLAKFLDEGIGHKEGQSIYYVAERNFSSASDVHASIKHALKENRLASPAEFLALLAAATNKLEKEFSGTSNKVP